MMVRTLINSGLLIAMLITVMMMTHCGNKQGPVTMDIPLPEHPRPDFMREEWINLNGSWDFSLDSLDVGEKEGWFSGEILFPDSITVPFSWASPLSGIGIKDVHVAWYARDIGIPRNWNGKRAYLIIGASDCVTTAWLNGVSLGKHEGGYTPFEFDLTDTLGDSKNHLVIRVEDKPTRGRLVGKQVYGEAKGIWQTVYLEVRNNVHITKAHFSPDIDSERVKLNLSLSEPVPEGYRLSLSFADTDVKTVYNAVPEGEMETSVDVSLEKPHLWNLDDPYLYDVDLILENEKREIDRVHSYFGMRKIGMAPLPGTQDMYITLNDKPVYLKMALDQSYHSEGYYTFPSDRFMREEIERAMKVGLNGLRIHIKTEVPRKLYWADRLGLLLMCDIPNIGGEPDEYGRSNWEYTASRQIERDYNHPSIFSWVLFNETWGLASRVEKSPGDFVSEYTPETREWVKSLYTWTKKIDPTRLVEDNSPDQNRRWHVITDINSWHVYLPGYKWASYMNMVVKNTYPGSSWNYIDTFRQDYVPMMNSECGNVWGYQGGTGDVDIGYEYHIMMNEYRRRPKICGFIFTEFHDVINEWNGYYRYDRSMKEWGLDELCPGMTVSDLHSDMYLIPGEDFKKVVKPGQEFSIPITCSFLTDDVPGQMKVETVMHGWNRYGDHGVYEKGQFTINPQAYTTFDLPPVKLNAPDEECLVIFCTYLLNDKGETVHHNFVPVRIKSENAPRVEAIEGGKVLRITPDGFSKSEWSVKQKSILQGKKVWGTGTGSFEYEFPWPKNLKADHVSEIEFIAELGARHIQGKDKGEDYVRQSISDVTSRGIDPGHNPNSYPMTDDTIHRSRLIISINGIRNKKEILLPDDPSDHRGILSWLNQKEEGRLNEAGSYGYLMRVRFGNEAKARAAGEGLLRVKLDVSEASENSGGLSVYGENFGRFPIDPTVVIHLKDNSR